MRILLIHQSFANGNQAGGTRHFELARHASKLGARFVFLTGKVNYLDSEARKHAREEFFEGHLEIFPVGWYNNLHTSYWRRLISFFAFSQSALWKALHTPSVDVVMGTSPSLFQAFSAWMVAAIKRRPFVLEIRDLWPQFAIELGILKSKKLIWMAEQMEKFLYRRADHIVVNSPAYKKILSDVHHVPIEKITLVPNGVDIEAFERELAIPESLCKLLGDQDRFVVMYAGAFGLANDVPVIIDAAKKLEKKENVVFILVGDGKERTTLVRKIEELGLKNVLFAGSFSKEQMPSVLSKSDVCIAILKPVPSFNTTYPNKVFDYMAAGKPTILAIDGVIREVIEKANAGVFVQPGDANALADAVLNLSNDRAQCIEMGLNAKRAVKDQFNRAEHAQMLFKVFEQVTQFQNNSHLERASSV